MITERAQVGWGFWLQWVLATAVGWAVGVVVGGDLFGAVVGAAQWLVLRRQGARTGWWVLASAVGWFVAMRVGGFLDEVLDWTLWYVSGVVGGAVVGAAQWLVLRQRVARAGWWVLPTVAGWVMFWFGAAMVFEINVFLGVVVVELIFGALYGAITGSMLVWLLQQPAPKASRNVFEQ